jgi:Na+-transporting methylmalonyl-CoA/oxaloacetate decarboxylase gamma subunit
MKTTKIVFVFIFLAIVAYPAIELGIMFRKSGNAAAELPKVVERQIKEQGEKTRLVAATVITQQSEELKKLVISELGNTRTLVSSELDRTRVSLATLASGEMDKTKTSLSDAIATLDNRLGAIQGDLNGQLTGFRTDTTSQLSGISGQFNANLQPFVSIGRQIDSAAPLFLDCDHNADCLFNRYVGTARGTEKTAESIGNISADISTLTRKLTEKKPWYKHLNDYFKLGIYGTATFLK